MYLNMLQQQQSQKTSDKEIIPDQVKKMDEEISVNELLSIEDDILDNEDDMERWSDFSIEEELPMHSHCGSSDEGIAEESSFKCYNKIGNLCQDNRFGTLASAADIVTQGETADMSEQMINFILDELIGDIVQYCEEDHRCTSDGFTGKSNTNTGEENGFTEKLEDENNEQQFALTHKNGDIENHHHEDIKAQYDILNNILCDPDSAADNPYLEQNNLSNGYLNGVKENHENILSEQCKNDICKNDDNISNHFKQYPVQIPNQIDYSNSIPPLLGMERKIQTESELSLISNNDTNNNNNLLIEDFAQALAEDVIHEILIEEEEKNFHHDHDDPDELFLVLHPPTHEDSKELNSDTNNVIMNNNDNNAIKDFIKNEDVLIYKKISVQENENHPQEYDLLHNHLEQLEKEVAELHECVEISEATAEAAQMELVKEKAKSESLQKVLEQQKKIFSIKFEQEEEHLKESKFDFLQLNEDRLKEKESFQKNIHSLQKSLQDKVNVIKEKEESNSLLRKETMELMARCSHEQDEMEQKLDTTRRDMLTYKRQCSEKDEKIVKLEETVEDAQIQLDQKKHEAKKLTKEVKKLKRLLEEERTKIQRNLQFNRIIDHINNID